MIKNNKKPLLLALILGFGMISCHKPLNTKNWTGQMRGIPAGMPTTIEELENQTSKINVMVNIAHIAFLSLSFTNDETANKAINNYLRSVPQHTICPKPNHNGSRTYRLFATKEEIYPLTKLFQQASNYKIALISTPNTPLIGKVTQYTTIPFLAGFLLGILCERNDKEYPCDINL